MTDEAPTPEPRWKEWRPKFAKHVLGMYLPRTYDRDAKMPDSQKWRVICEQCGQRFQGECMTGAVRGHISRFAVQHVHVDPLAAPRVERPNSLRVKA